MSKPRVAITAGDPSGIGPEVAAAAASEPAIRDICEPVVYGPATRTVISAGRAERRGRSCRLRRHRSRRRRRPARRGGRGRDGTHQQGGLPAGGPSMVRPHGSPRAPDQRATRGHDVSLGSAAGRAGDGSRGPGRSSGAPDEAADGVDHHADGARDATVRISCPADRRRRPQSACWRARLVRTGGGRGDCPGDCRGARQRHRCRRPVSGRYRLRPRHARRIRRGRRLLSRSGADPGQACGVWPGGERDARPANRADVGRSRHGVRHRRQGRGRPRQHDRGGEAGGEACRSSFGCNPLRASSNDARTRARERRRVSGLSGLVERS